MKYRFGGFSFANQFSKEVAGNYGTSITAGECTDFFGAAFPDRSKASPDSLQRRVPPCVGGKAGTRSSTGAPVPDSPRPDADDQVGISEAERDSHLEDLGF